LDERGTGSRISRPADISVAVHTAALVGHRRDADIAGELAAVGEGPIEHLAHQHCRDIRADAADALQTNNFLDRRVVGSRFCCRGPLGFQLTDQLQD
jgi:hypothetical protein